mgnify:FL=1
MKIIPHSWQDYPTIGNYFYVKGGTFVIFCSDLKNDEFHFLVFAHEMIEATLVLSRGIKLSKIDNFDIKFEKDNKEGEPGDDLKSPYRKEHRFAENIERLLAAELGIDFNEYNKILEKQFTNADNK